MEKIIQNENEANFIQLKPNIVFAVYLYIIHVFRV